MGQQLEKSYQGKIKCSYVPGDILKNPTFYSDHDKTLLRIDQLLSDTSKYFPLNYKRNFQKRHSFENGAEYSNFEIPNVEDSSRILVASECDAWVGMEVTDNKLYLPRIETEFNFCKTSEAVTLLIAFERNFVFNSRNGFADIQRLGINGQTIEEAGSLLTKLFGNRKEYAIFNNNLIEISKRTA